MKKLNLTLIIEIVLTIAVIVLFILHFKSSKPGSNGNLGQVDTTTHKGSGPIAYVNIDTVIHQYAMYEEFKGKFTGKQQLFESEMTNKSKTYQISVQDYQNKVQKGLITRAEAADKEQQLGAEQQKLIQLRDQYQSQLAEEEQVMNRQILNSVMEYLTEYNKDKGYNYILGNTFGGNVLYANKALDITKDVLKGLNEKYKTEKDSKKK
jgi:outer membrane protein